MTLDEIKNSHRVDAVWAQHSPLTRQMYLERAKLIEWLDRAMPLVTTEAEREARVAGVVRTVATPATDLLREIEGEKK